MRRPLLIVTVFGAVLLLALRLNGSRQRFRAEHPVVRLRGGTLFRVEGLTRGTNQMLRLEPELVSKVKQRMPGWIQAQIGAPRLPLTIDDSSEAHLWFSLQDPVTGTNLSVGPAVELTALDGQGQRFAASGQRTFGSLGAPVAARFSTLDWRAPQLKFWVQSGGGVHEVVVPNPRHGERFPVWTPRPLPQMQSRDGFDFTLLRPFPSSGPAPPHAPDNIRVSADGHDVLSWFRFHSQFVDPTGNRDPVNLPASEPVWALELTAVPSERFPFPPERGFHLGALRIPEAGKFSFVEGSAAATNAGLRCAWVAGSGSFNFRDGQKLSATAFGRGGSGASASLGDSWTVSHEAADPTLHLLLRAPATGGFLVPRREGEPAVLMPRITRADGSFVELGSNGISANDAVRQRDFHYGYRLRRVKVGETVDVDLFLAEAFQVTFTFAAQDAPAVSTQPGQ